MVIQEWLSQRWVPNAWLASFFKKKKKRCESVYVHIHLETTGPPSSLGMSSTFFETRFLIGLKLQWPFCLCLTQTRITNLYPTWFSKCVLGNKLKSSSLWGKHITSWATSIAHDWYLQKKRKFGLIQKHQARTHREHTLQEDIARRPASKGEAFKKKKKTMLPTLSSWKSTYIPEQWEHKLELFQLHSLWHFVVTLGAIERMICFSMSVSE